MFWILSTLGFNLGSRRCSAYFFSVTAGLDRA
jgi:hypothetical protein